MAGTYFNSDWRIAGRWWLPLGPNRSVPREHLSPQDVVEGFKLGEPSEVGRAIADIDALLASSMSEEEMYKLWFDELGGEYYPARDGLTYRQWFAEVRRLLASSLLVGS